MLLFFCKIILYFFIIYHLLVLFIGLYKDINKYNISYFEFLERLCIYKSKKINKCDILFHAVSCGEAKTITNIIDLLNDEYITKKYNKELKYLFTIHTPTAFRIINNKNKYNVILKPFDIFPTILYLILKIQPKYLIICESDIWLIYYIIAKIYGCKIFLINYKLKKKKIIRNIIHSYLVDKFYTKEEYTKTDLNMILLFNSFLKRKTHSIILSKYTYLGNLKFLIDIPIIKFNKKYKKVTIVIGSAGENELDIHIKYITSIIKYSKNINFIYIPRHLNWKSNFINNINNTGIAYKFIDNIEFIKEDNINLYVYWGYGLLTNFYSKSNICLIGNTFNNIGGHNIIEPIVNLNHLLIGPIHYTCIDIINKMKHTNICCDEYSLINTTKNIINNLENYNYKLVENYNEIIKNRNNIKNNIEKEINLI